MKMSMSGHDVHSPAMMMDGDLAPGRTEASPPMWPLDSPQRHSRSPSVRSPRASRVAQSASQLRRRAGRDSAKKTRGGVTIKAPISQLTAHLDHIPIKDMEAVANRSAAERQKEIQSRRKEPRDKDNIPRPMNSFMFYRSAFAARIKAYLQVPNHQEISRIAGMSWKMETPEVRAIYENLASLERENHATAHPSYKFKPKKGPAASRRVGDITPPSSVASGHITDTDSSLWDEGFMGMPPMPHQSTSYDLDYASSSRGSTPFNDMGGYMGSQNYFPGYSTPTHISTVEPNVLHGVGSHGLTFHHGSPVPPEMPYGSSSGLAGLPGGTHADLLQPQSTHPGAARITDSGHVDPNLLFASSAPSALATGHAYPEVPGSLSWEEETGSCYMAPGDSSNPAPFHTSQMPAGFLPTMQRDSSWDPSQPDSSFMGDDAWLSDPHTPASAGF
ncbi:transcriptional regulator family: HMG [Penicillium capsulatum]|uniref:Transcriptional regulator family: HMG n=1 Tax=Penicillium capsulatum TaxID=69766 RepID=A0A9W9ITB4_9EURO|nr:transcriptional regulator family: HMG [Penicillium capsulatum]KAJ6129679.1 transcriptional regulator family: HMG [Penicillium capsulatum]